MPSEPLLWQIATVSAIRDETPTVKSITLAVPRWPTHRAGQHLDIRLTAPDGYQAQRSYSIASAPGRDGQVDVTIDRIPDGEVSPYFHDVIVVGDQVEVRGPIGGYFVWEPGLGGPLLLVAGGSGVVPLMAMIRARAAAHSSAAATLLYSSRTIDDVIYRAELDNLVTNGGNLKVVHTFTRTQPPGWAGFSRRIDGPMLTEVHAGLGPQPLVYVCGPTLLVEAVANDLVDLGASPPRIRTERFGPTS
ncbi:MAG: ferredoxin reductase [Candidatus Limnocylindria bacterium]